MRTLDSQEMNWCGGKPDSSVWGCFGAAAWVLIDLVLIGLSEGTAGAIVGGFLLDNVAMVAACLYAADKTQEE